MKKLLLSAVAAISLAGNVAHAQQAPTQVTIQKRADDEEARRIDNAIEWNCKVYARGFIVKDDYLSTVTAIRDYCANPENARKAHARIQEIQKMYSSPSAAHTACVSGILAYMPSSVQLYGGASRYMQNAEAACSGL
jgi:hypothetical protein